MKNYHEQNRLWFKASYDAIRHISDRAETANQKYDALADKFNKYSVISNEIEGRESQLVQISTTFGTEDPSDPNTKEFLFNPGSVLRYARVLPYTHNDGLEVVNFQTMMNAIYNNDSNLINSLSGYLLKNGDTASGTFLFQKTTPAANDTVTFDSIPVRFINGATASLDTGTLATVTENTNSLINKAYADLNYKVQTGLGAGTQPVFTSGKIAIHNTNNQLIIKGYGKYTTEAISADGTTFLKIKLLKYNGKTAWDLSDKSWVELFGNTPQNTISGYDTGLAVGKIPYPVSFSLFVEYELDSTTYPFSLINSNSRVRAELPNTIGQSVSGGYSEYSVIIDSDGDLCLILETDFQINIPYSSSKIALNCNSTNKALLYLVVDRWSYLAKDNAYIDSIGNANPSPLLLFVSQSWNRAQSDTGAITIRYRLLYANIVGAITWSSDKDSVLGITYGQDTLGYYADIVFPVGETIYDVTFTANFAGGPLTKTVSLQLKDYTYVGITSITPSTFITTRWDLYPASLPISFTCAAIGGNSSKTWSILASDGTLGTTTLSNAAINSSTGVLTGDYTDANVDEYVIVSVTDGTSTYKQKLTISVNEYTSGYTSGDTTIDGQCFGENTYILTTKGPVKIKDITLQHHPINLNLDSFGSGIFELRNGKIKDISYHKPNVEVINIHGIDVTVNHPFGLANGLWKFADSITKDDYLVKLVEPDTIIKDAFEGATKSNYSGNVWNIHLEELNYFVSSSETGPWYLVHNISPIYKS